MPPTSRLDADFHPSEAGFVLGFPDSLKRFVRLTGNFFVKPWVKTRWLKTWPFGSPTSSRPVAAKITSRRLAACADKSSWPTGFWTSTGKRSTRLLRWWTASTATQSSGERWVSQRAIIQVSKFLHSTMSQLEALKFPVHYLEHWSIVALESY